jgi:hypothetical protein
MLVRYPGWPLNWDGGNPLRALEEAGRFLSRAIFTVELQPEGRLSIAHFERS